MSQPTAARRLAPRPRALGALGARLLAALLDRRLALLVLICGLSLLAAAQAPLRFAFVVGHDGGPQTDRPFLRGFLPAEQRDPANRWRWTRPEASVIVPGVAARQLLVSFRVLAHRQDFQPTAPPTQLTLSVGAGPPTTLTLARGPARRYQLLMPPEATAGGILRLDLSTAGWQNPGDERGTLGVAIGGSLTLHEAAASRPLWPGPVALAFPFALALLWLAARTAGVGPNVAFWALLMLVALLALLTLLAPPRLAVSSRWAVQSALIVVGAVGAGMLAIPRLLARWAVPTTPTTTTWLILLAALGFGLKFGGQLHPLAMRGDLQFHINRFQETALGELYLFSLHRGFPFPYPTGWYAVVAPLTLTGLPIGTLFELTAGLFDAAAVVLIYLLLAKVTRSAAGGLLGATIYAVSPVWFLVVAWGFQAQIASQWFVLALMTLLIVRWPRYDDPLIWGSIVLLMSLASLSHIGATINLAATAALALPWLWLRARDERERRAVRRLCLGAGIAALFALVCYYSAFTGPILAQLGAIADEGLPGVTERAPVGAAVLLGSFWQDGLIEHYGFFIVALGVAGATLLAFEPHERHGALPPLLWSTCIVVLLQALLPLLTQSSITTRYLTFGGWAFTVGATIAGLRLWRSGRAGRVVLVAMLAFAAWLSLSAWSGAMLLNLWPAEPF